PTRAWKPVEITVSDATGNTYKPFSLFPEQRGAETRLYFDGALWPDEPAWKVRTEFARIAGFSPAELWTVRGLALPQSGSASYSNVEATRQGVTLRLYRIRRRRPRSLAQRLPSWLRYDTGIDVLVTPPSDGLRLTLLRA